LKVAGADTVQDQDTINEIIEKINKYSDTTQEELRLVSSYGCYSKPNTKKLDLDYWTTNGTVVFINKKKYKIEFLLQSLQNRHKIFSSLICLIQFL